MGGGNPPPLPPPPLPRRFIGAYVSDCNVPVDTAIDLLAEAAPLLLHGAPVVITLKVSRASCGMIT